MVAPDIMVIIRVPTHIEKHNVFDYLVQEASRQITNAFPGIAQHQVRSTWITQNQEDTQMYAFNVSIRMWLPQQDVKVALAH